MLYYEYALDPEVIDSWERARYFLEAFGEHRGRFIGDSKQKWLRQVYLLIEGNPSVPQQVKHRIAEQLARLKEVKAFVPRLGKGQDQIVGESWFERTKKWHLIEPYRAIIIKEEKAGGDFLPADSVTSTNPLWKVEHDKEFNLDRPEELAAILRFLLSRSTWVAIIDPYFRPQKKRKASVLKHLVSSLGSGAELQIHVKQEGLGDEDYNEFRESAATDIPKLVPKGVRVKLFMWRDGEMDMHNRYILTNIGGVKTGNSFEAKRNGVDEVSRLSVDTYNFRVSRHVDNPKRWFKSSGECIEVVGRGEARR